MPRSRSPIVGEFSAAWTHVAKRSRKKVATATMLAADRPNAPNHPASSVRVLEKSIAHWMTIGCSSTNRATSVAMISQRANRVPRLSGSLTTFAGSSR